MTRVLEVCPDTPSVDHHESWNLLDPEVLDEIRSRLGANPDKPERVVVPATLQHLRQKRLRSPRRSGRPPVEEHETRTLFRCRGWCGELRFHTPESHRLTWRLNVRRQVCSHDEDHAEPFVAMVAQLGKRDLADDRLPPPVVAGQGYRLLPAASERAP